ncbi:MULTISPECIES: AMP-binding protein [unclassified Crossiella]|uniref:AMP-binding protein n=1 Tax=unclassified Crossiella TaxID=2620835 RepID=UPI001FFFE734|nr:MULTISPECIES: AMP-binding protein [unclassified Crossiella]MCK2244629.1 AMP-binding protein [Crossiella sp. S99.2]MCK2258384.1 AMP-binding protein [Crossiella sp. S99.1]
MPAAPAPPVPADLLGLWADAVRDHPRSPALRHDSGTITYARAEEITDAWAAELAHRGARPGSFVALEVCSAADLVLGLLAVLKCGAACTVLDPALPPADRADLLAVLGYDVLLAGPAVIQGVRLDLGVLADAPFAWRHRLTSGDQIAYAHFTSGRTGTAIARRSLALFAGGVAGRLGLGPADRWLQLGSPAADVVLEEVLPVLAAGGSVVCRKDFTALDVPELHHLIEHTGATVAELSTRSWLAYARWLRRHELRTAPRLRAVLVRGERLDPGAYRDWQHRGLAAVHHVYGMAETTVTNTVHSGQLTGSATEVPLGTPLPGVELSIRDGEVWLSGEFVGLGHLGDPPNPDRFHLENGVRRYRTGTLGHLDDNGDLVCTGQVDEQLTVLGHQVAPEALARLLERHPLVAQAVLGPDASGTRLLAFLVPANGETGRVAKARIRELHALLDGVLPPALLPRTCLRVPKLPGNPANVELAKVVRIVGLTGRTTWANSTAGLSMRTGDHVHVPDPPEGVAPAGRQLGVVGG